MKCFICSEGHVWTIRDSDGHCNYPGTVEVVGDKVCVVERMDDNYLNGRVIKEEFILYPSLLALSQAIDAQNCQEWTQTLDKFVHQQFRRLIAFRMNWLNNHAQSPEEWPAVMREQDWLEQLELFQEEEDGE